MSKIHNFLRQRTKTETETKQKQNKSKFVYMKYSLMGKMHRNCTKHAHTTQPAAADLFHIFTRSHGSGGSWGVGILKNKK